MKKLLSLLLAMLLVVGCAGCSNSEEKNTESSGESTTDSADETEAVEKAVTAYLDYRAEGVENFEEFCEDAEKFMDPDGKVMEEMEKALDEFDTSIEAAQNNGMSKKDAEKLMTHVQDVMAKSSSYKIQEITVDDDSAKVEIEQTIADQSILSEAFDEEFQALLKKTTEEKHTNGQTFANIDEFMTAFNATDRQLQLQIIQECYDAYLEDILDAITEAAEDEDNHITEAKTITLVKIDGEWLVSKVK